MFLVKEKQKAFLSLLSPFPSHFSQVNPPNLSPFFVLTKTNVFLYLSHFKWKSFAPSLSLLPLYNKTKTILLFSPSIISLLSGNLTFFSLSIKKSYSFLSFIILLSITFNINSWLFNNSSNFSNFFLNSFNSFFKLVLFVLSSVICWAKFSIRRSLFWLFLINSKLFTLEFPKYEIFISKINLLLIICNYEFYKKSYFFNTFFESILNTFKWKIK